MFPEGAESVLSAGGRITGGKSQGGGYKDFSGGRSGAGGEARIIRGFAAGTTSWLRGLDFRAVL